MFGEIGPDDWNMIAIEKNIIVIYIPHLNILDCVFNEREVTVWCAEVLINMSFIDNKKISCPPFYSPEAIRELIERQFRIWRIRPVCILSIQFHRLEKYLEIYRLNG